MTTQDAGVAVIRPVGDIVAASVPDLRTEMRGSIAAGARRVTIDLTRVEMIDSVGLGLLIAAHNSLTRVGGELSVINASKEILDLFVAMRMHQHFSVRGAGAASGGAVSGAVQPNTVPPGAAAPGAVGLNQAGSNQMGSNHAERA